MVDLTNLLLYPFDSVACLCSDHGQAAGRGSLHLGPRRDVVGNSHYLAVGDGRIQALRRNDAVRRRLADALGKTAFTP